MDGSIKGPCYAFTNTRVSGVPVRPFGRSTLLLENSLESQGSLFGFEKPTRRTTTRAKSRYQWGPDSEVPVAHERVNKPSMEGRTSDRPGRSVVNCFTAVSSYLQWRAGQVTGQTGPRPPAIVWGAHPSMEGRTIVRPEPLLCPGSVELR